jgi:hypothetical protein
MLAVEVNWPTACLQNPRNHQPKIPPNQKILESYNSRHHVSPRSGPQSWSLETYDVGRGRPNLSIAPLVRPVKFVGGLIEIWAGQHVL